MRMRTTVTTSLRHMRLILIPLAWSSRALMKTVSSRSRSMITSKSAPPAPPAPPPAPRSASRSPPRPVARWPTPRSTSGTALNPAVTRSTAQQPAIPAQPPRTPPTSRATHRALGPFSYAGRAYPAASPWHSPFRTGMGTGTASSHPIGQRHDATWHALRVVTRR